MICRHTAADRPTFPIVLESSRLILREFDIGDWRSIQEYASDPEVVQYLPWGPNTEQETIEYVLRMISLQKDRPRTQFHLAITLKPEEMVIGACCIVLCDADAESCPAEQGERGASSLTARKCRVVVAEASPLTPAPLPQERGNKESHPTKLGGQRASGYGKTCGPRGHSAKDESSGPADGENNHKEGWIGYVLNRGHWGKGYTTEAASALVRFGFEELNLERIIASCDTRNAASARVLEKCGMKRVGRQDRHKFQRGVWRDSYFYGIKREEWTRSAAPRSPALP